VAQNELVIQSIPAESLSVNFFKACNSLATLACIFGLFRYYYLSAIFQRLTYHLDLGLPLEETVFFAQHLHTTSKVQAFTYSDLAISPYLAALSCLRQLKHHNLSQIVTLWPPKSIFQVPLRRIFEQPSLWLEVIFCAIHVPPGVGAEYVTNTMGNIIVYRLETIGCLINTLRIYMLWGVFRDR